MKVAVLTITALVVWHILSGCNYTIVCKQAKHIKYFNIEGYDTAVQQYLRVVRYEAGSNFTRPIDSTEKKTGYSFELPVSRDIDYHIAVLPQNRRHTLTGVTFGKEKRKGSPGRDSEQCTTSITFNLNGTVMTQPMAVGSVGGYLRVVI